MHKADRAGCRFLRLRGQIDDAVSPLVEGTTKPDPEQPMRDARRLSMGDQFSHYRATELGRSTEVGHKLAPLSEVDQSQLRVARGSDLDDVQA